MDEYKRAMRITRQAPNDPLFRFVVRDAKLANNPEVQRWLRQCAGAVHSRLMAVN